MHNDPTDHRAIPRRHAALKVPRSAASLSLDILFEAPLSPNASVLDLHYDCQMARRKKPGFQWRRAGCVMGRTFVGA
jgi:hypothetical protein